MYDILIVNGIDTLNKPIVNEVFYYVTNDKLLFLIICYSPFDSFHNWLYSGIN